MMNPDEAPEVKKVEAVVDPFQGNKSKEQVLDSPLNKFLLNWADVICIRACGTDLSNVLSLRWRRLLLRGSDHSALKGWTLTSSKIGCRHDLHDSQHS